ncbi:MAG: hypothetical protein IKI37_08805 [Oscillospiraceae bacterium]|nr:hypothetical protein [Oscillospiraceae bacterium]
MFRIAVNAPCEEVISLLNEKILMQKETFRRYKISNYIAEIYQNEDYDKIITDDFLYYQTNADFCEMQNISLNEEIDFAKSVQQIFRNQGWQAEIIAEFEELL